jgi:hypothetical protein
MSHFLPRMLLLALVATCSSAVAADELQWISPDGQGQENLLTSYGKPAETTTACPACEQNMCDNCGCGCGADCDGCPRFGLVGFAGVDNFRGVSDGTWNDNFGVVTGLNAGIPIYDTGLAWQMGLSYGVYDFDGRMSSALERSACQTQTFVTTGFYHKANNGRRLSFGLVYDWMLNDNWGVAAIDPTLGQWRGQIEFALNQCNSVGIYATKSDKSSSNWGRMTGDLLPRRFSTRSVDQASVFFHHKFEQGADGKLWVGLPEQDRLTDEGSLGEWLAGAQIEVPLGQRFALYAGAQYMKPSASPGNGGSYQDSTDVFVGLSYYPGRNARTTALNGSCSTPYMPVANNSTFLVDQTPTN